MVDFHTHILPGVDDGSDSVEQSLEMLALEREQGIDRVVLTPHFYPERDGLNTFLDKRAEAFEKLSAEVRKDPTLPALILGAEVAYYPGMSNVESLRELTVGDTDYILIEMPMVTWTDAMYQELAALPSRQGLTPIIAHIDRYIGPLRTYGIPQRLEEMPVLVQANGAFFTSWQSRRLANKLLQEEKIHLLGSDCHSVHYRPPCLKSAFDEIESTLGQAALTQLEMAEKMILGDTVTL